MNLTSVACTNMGVSNTIGSFSFFFSFFSFFFSFLLDKSFLKIRDCYLIFFIFIFFVI